MITVVKILFIVAAIAFLAYNCHFFKSIEGRQRFLMHITVGTAIISVLYRLSVICAYDLQQTIFYGERLLESDRDTEIWVTALVLWVITTFVSGVYHTKRVNELVCDDNWKDKIIYVIEMLVRICVTFITIMSVIAHFDVSSIEAYSLHGMIAVFILKWVILVPVITRVTKYAFDRISQKIWGI